MHSIDSTFCVYTAKETDAGVGWVYQFDEYVAVASVSGVDGSTCRVAQEIWSSYWIEGSR